MTINPESPVPAYQQIAADLRDAIRRGDIAGQLPSLRSLREQYATSAGTVNKALDELENEGIIIVRQGRGAFVHTPKRLARYGSRRHVLAERPDGKGPLEYEAEQQGSRREQIVEDVVTTNASSDIAARLRINPGDGIVIREYVINVDDLPSQIVASFFPEHIATGTVLTRKEKVSGGVHDFLVNHLGIRLNPFAVEDVVARMPTPTERRILSLPIGVPILELWRTFLDQDDRPVEVTQFLLAADRNMLVYEVPLG